MMRDFDKFFAEKLGEEGQFPRREKNWRALSNRLDAFDTGLQHHSGHIRRYLRYWQAVAACTIVAAAWLTWKVATLQSDNAGLRREMAALQEKNMAAGQETALSGKNLPDGRPSAVAPAAGVEKSKNLAARPLDENEHPAHGGNLLTGKRKDTRPPTGRSGEQEPVSADRFVSETTSYEKNPPLGNQGNITDTTDSTAAQVAALAILPHRIAYTPDSSLQSIAASQPVGFQKSLPLPPPDTTAASAAPKVIRPAHNPSRLRAGIQVLAGLPVPYEKGISLLTGHGINAEYRIWRNFWLMGSADWLRYDISTEKYIPKFHSHHHDPPPQGGSPQEKLVKVESTQRQQQFALGLRYSLPVRAWIRPAVRVAYSTTRTSPELTTFKFEHQGQGGPGGQQPPKYKIQKSDSQIIGNIWRFGAGLEHETQRWAFGLWADYSKNFTASDPTFDALQLRAGIQYTFN